MALGGKDMGFQGMDLRWLGPTTKLSEKTGVRVKYVDLKWEFTDNWYDIKENIWNIYNLCIGTWLFIIIIIFCFRLF